MKQIIIDIGSGNVKTYDVQEFRGARLIHLKNIMFKKNFTTQNGISKEDEEQLIEEIINIRKSNPDAQIHAYATSVFRMLNNKNLKELQSEVIQKTGIKINVISQEKEEQYMAGAVGNIEEIKEPYLVCCVGGSSTEMIVMQEGKIIEQLTEEFATGDMLKKFPQISEDTTDLKIEDLRDYIKNSFVNLPKTKCRFAIFTGFHLMYNTVAGNDMQENTFFKRENVPYYITTKQFNENNENALNNRSLNELKKKYPENPNFMDGTRGANTIVGYILERIGAEFYFPTNLNMIDGIISELRDKNKGIER